MRDLEAYRDDDGSYVVRGPNRVREPVAWLLVMWVAAGTVGTIMPFVGVAHWLLGW